VDIAAEQAGSDAWDPAAAEMLGLSL